MNIISIKDFRQLLAKVADAVAKGETFTVMRRSKPAFIVQPCNIEEIDEKLDQPGWNTVMDFTEGGKKSGIPVTKLVKIIEKVIAEDEQNRKIYKRTKKKRAAKIA